MSKPKTMNSEMFVTYEALIEKHYNPENDIAEPRVSHIEMDLLHMVMVLERRVAELETTISFLERTHPNPEKSHE